MKYLKKKISLPIVLLIIVAAVIASVGVTYAVVELTTRKITLLHGESIQVTGNVNVTDVETFVGSSADADNVATSDNKNKTPHEDSGTTDVIENHIVVRITLSEDAADTWLVDSKIDSQVRIYTDGVRRGTFTWIHRSGGSVAAVRENVKLTVDTGDIVYPATLSVQVEPK